jgi:hypothetical protein
MAYDPQEEASRRIAENLKIDAARELWELERRLADEADAPRREDDEIAEKARNELQRQ